jgi:hypothetical protein
MDSVRIADSDAQKKAFLTAETLMHGLGLRTGSWTQFRGHRLLLKRVPFVSMISVQDSRRAPLGVLILTYFGQSSLLSASYSKLKGKEMESPPQFVLSFLAQLRKITANAARNRQDMAGVGKNRGYRDAAQRELRI